MHLPLRLPSLGRLSALTSRLVQAGILQTPPSLGIKEKLSWAQQLYGPSALGTPTVPSFWSVTKDIRYKTVQAKFEFSSPPPPGYALSLIGCSSGGDIHIRQVLDLL